MDFKKAVTDHATGAAALPDGALMAFKSHIEGKNAQVAVYPDRIEWTRTRMLGRTATDMVLMRAVSGVTTHKAGLSYTNVRIEAGSSSVVMRVTKAQATELRRVVLERVADR